MTSKGNIIDPPITSFRVNIFSVDLLMYIYQICSFALDSARRCDSKCINKTISSIFGFSTFLVNISIILPLLLSLLGLNTYCLLPMPTPSPIRLCLCLSASAYAHAIGRAHALRPCAGPSEATPAPPWTIPPAPLRMAPRPAHMRGEHGPGPWHGHRQTRIGIGICE